MQATVDRIQRSRELHAWKQDTAFARSFTGRQRQGGDEEVLLQASTARFTPDGRLMYVLRDDRVGGLYQQDLNSGEEKRLVHRQIFVLDDLTPSADGTRLLASQRASNGSANICLMAVDGGGYRELTSGDTVDSAPAWVSNEPEMVLYQTSGLARAPSGQVLAIGPASIQLLDAAKSSVTPVLDDAQQDFLQPEKVPVPSKAPGDNVAVLPQPPRVKESDTAATATTAKAEAQKPAAGKGGYTVQSGDTLRDNDLEVLTTIGHVSARLVMNRGAYLTDREALRAIAARIVEACRTSSQTAHPKP